LRKAKKLKKMRLDETLFCRGLADSIKKARALIMSGSVSVKGRMIDKAGRPVTADSEITLKSKSPLCGKRRV